MLLEIQDYFGCGTIRPDRSDKTVKWEAQPPPTSSGSKRVIPHFHRYPLRSGKSNDFELFDPQLSRSEGGEQVGICDPEEGRARSCDGPAQ